jgi:hypothetical protein
MLGGLQTGSEMLAERRPAEVKIQLHKSQPVMRLSFPFYKACSKCPENSFSSPHHLAGNTIKNYKRREKNLDSTWYCIDKQNKRNKDVSTCATVIFVQLW